MYKLELEFSYLSGKRKITENGRVIHETSEFKKTKIIKRKNYFFLFLSMITSAFQYPFSLDGNSLNIIQQGEAFELRINNQVFTHLYNQSTFFKIILEKKN